MGPPVQRSTTRTLRIKGIAGALFDGIYVLDRARPKANRWVESAAVSLLCVSASKSHAGTEPILPVCSRQPAAPLEQARRAPLLRPDQEPVGVPKPLHARRYAVLAVFPGGGGVPKRCHIDAHRCLLARVSKRQARLETL